MKVAIVINTSWNIYNFRGGLIKGLQEEGWEVVAIAPKDNYSSKLINEFGIRHVEIDMQNKGTNPVKDYQLYKSYLRIYRQEIPDVVLHFTIKPNIYGTLAASRLDIPVINNISGLGTTFIRKNIVSKIAAKLYRYSLKKAHKVFFQNDDDRQLFLELKLVKPSITGLLPGSGINLKKFSPAKATGTFNFLFVARLIYDKGLMEYLEAAEMLRKKGIKAQFDMVGFIDDEAKLGMSREELEGWIQKGVVNYLGEVEDIRSIMAAANVIVLPSYREGTPKTLLEALAMAKPIVATNVPGCRETVINGVNGYLCQVKSARDLAEKMANIYALPASEIDRMGEASRKYAEEKFDEKLVIDSYKEVIKSLNHANQPI